MSNALLKYDERPVSTTLATVGLGGLALGGIAALVPGITLPMLLVIVAVVGVLRLLTK